MDFMKSYDIQPSLNPSISDSLQPLIDMLTVEWDLWAIKKQSKTIDIISKYKWALVSLQTCIYKNDWKGAYVSMQREDINTTGLKACFRGDHDKQQRALKLYRTVMLKVIEWLKIMFKI